MYVCIYIYIYTYTYDRWNRNLPSPTPEVWQAGVSADTQLISCSYKCLYDII